MLRQLRNTDVSLALRIPRHCIFSSNTTTNRLLCIGLNRAIPDELFECFIDEFAHRVASWDHEGIAAAKKIINEQSVFPSAAEWKEGFTAFATDFERAVVQNRVAACKKAGLQTNVQFEKDMSDLVLEYTGPGPWNV